MAIELTQAELEYLEEMNLQIELERALDEEAELEYFELLEDACGYPLGY